MPIKHGNHSQIFCIFVSRCSYVVMYFYTLYRKSNAVWTTVSIKIWKINRFIVSFIYTLEKRKPQRQRQHWFKVIVCNATFNNISDISWRSVLLVEETGGPGENRRPAESHWQTLSYNVVSSIPSHEWYSNSQLYWW
jgi:hypothetical protein